MSILKKLKQALSNQEEDPEKVRQEKKEQINNLTESNDFVNESVNKLFDLLDD